MQLIIIVVVVWAVAKIASRASEKRKAEAMRRAKAEKAWRLAMEAEQHRVAKEQLRQAKEQERLAKEQERQAAQLAKHEEQIQKLQLRLEQAENNIEFLNDRIDKLDAKRDYLLLEQSGTTVGGKEWLKYQDKILAVENQTNAALGKLRKAQHDRQLCKSKLEVA